MGSQFDEHCCNNCEGWPLSYRRNIKTKDFDKIMAAIKITAFGMRSNATPIFDSYHPPPLHLTREYNVRSSFLFTNVSSFT